MIRILVVEDETAYVEALTVSLEREGYEVDAAEDGRSGLRLFRETAPDVVLLDLMLPGLSGMDVLRKMREEATTPVIVLSAKDAESDVVAALELGADDYLTKPYSVRELLARIRVALRRTAPVEDPDVIVAGSVVLDLSRHQVRVGDHEAEDLPRKEFGVLRMFMERQGRVVTRDALIDEVWGFGWAAASKTLDQHIRRLRRRLEADPASPRIETLRGVGYRLEVPDA